MAWTEREHDRVAHALAMAAETMGASWSPLRLEGYLQVLGDLPAEDVVRGIARAMHDSSHSTTGGRFPLPGDLRRLAGDAPLEFRPVSYTHLTLPTNREV